MVFRVIGTCFVSYVAIYVLWVASLVSRREVSLRCVFVFHVLWFALVSCRDPLLLFATCLSVFPFRVNLEVRSLEVCCSGDVLAMSWFPGAAARLSGFLLHVIEGNQATHVVYVRLRLGFKSGA